MENIYVISDLHGQGKLFPDAEKIKFSEADIMYILGDVIDRGRMEFPCLNISAGSPI